MNNYTFKAKKNYDKLRFFLKDISFSDNLIKKLSKQIGQVTKNNKSLIMNDKVFKNDIISINYYIEKENTIQPVKHYLDIVYEDDYYLIVSKPNGVATIPSFCNNEISLGNFVTEYMKDKKTDFIFRAINRLDKETSGLILICKDLISYDLINKNAIHKKYEAIVENRLTKQIINKKIKTIIQDDGKNEIKRIIDDSGKTAITNILSTKYNKKHNISYCIIKLYTGRTHQIRVHLSSISNPILGDKLYGTDNANRMYLHCYYMKFYHPFKKKNIVLRNKTINKIFKSF